MCRPKPVIAPALGFIPGLPAPERSSAPLSWIIGCREISFWVHGGPRKSTEVHGILAEGPAESRNRH